MKASLCIAIFSAVCANSASGSPVESPESAYVLIDNVAAIEAEALQYNSVWQRRTDKTGFTGGAWLQYVGPERHGDESSGQHNDPDGRYQGSPSDWLRVPVYLTQQGVHYVQIHAFHTVPCCGFINGDATVWTHAEGFPYPVRFSHGETASGANSFKFMGYGPLCYNAEEDALVEHASFVIREVPQVVTFYVSGRDRYFGVDRIHIYRRIGPDNLDRGAYPVNADNKLAPLSYKIAVPTTAITDVSRPQVAPRARTAGFTVVSAESRSSTPAHARQLFDLRGSLFSAKNGGAVVRGCVAVR
jgi:hypothetical protein